jgi:hypothetical protein
VKAAQYGTWQVSHPGDDDTPAESWLWEPDDTSLSDCMLIETETGGLTFAEWLNGIDPERRPMNCQVLVWYLRRKAGQLMDRTSVVFPIRKLDVVEAPKDLPSTDGSDPSTSPTSPDSDTDQPISTP